MHQDLKEILNDEERFEAVLEGISDAVDYLHDKHDEVLEANPDLHYIPGVIAYMRKLIRESRMNKRI